MKDESMTCVASFHLVDDAKTLEAIAAHSGFILAAGLAASILWLGCGWPHAPFSWAWLGILAAIALVSLVVLPVHELIHGLAFKVLGGRSAKLRFGYLAPGMLYTSCEGAVFSRQQFIGILLAPALVVTAALAWVGVCLGYPLAAFVCIFLHLSGCTGDFAMARYLAKAQGAYVRDTSYGIDLVEPLPAAAAKPRPPLSTISGADVS